MIRAAILAASLTLLASCSADRVGWGRRGRFWRLQETPTLQVRRGPQILDAATGDLVITWLGVRAPEGEPPVLACELVVFEDRNRNGEAEPAEILCVRESLERTTKVLFDHVRFHREAGSPLRARLVARTEREIRTVSWTPAPD